MSTGRAAGAAGAAGDAGDAGESGRGAVLVTGATGLVGLEVARTLVRRAVPVVAFARGRSPGARELDARARAGELRFVRGDLDRKDLDLSRRTLDELSHSVTSVVHAGAIYSFSEDRARILQTNVGGLDHLLAHVITWEVRGFHQVSSIIAAGRREGRVAEEPLDRAPSYRNAYEESKWISEQRVIDALGDRLRIYRPGSVLGHSVTGETTKFDGTYMALSLMRRSPVFPIPGRGARPFPVVTVDLVADAIAAGLGSPPRGTEVVHVLDLEKPSLADLMRNLSRRVAGHERLWRVPERLFVGASRVPGFRRFTGIEPVGAEYMTSRAEYRTDAFERFCAVHDIDARRIGRAYDALTDFYLRARGGAEPEERSA